MKPLSFIIITYNRPDDMLELARNISGLDQADVLLEEVVIVNNRSTDSYQELTDFLATVPHIPFRYYEAPENLGVARGRNYALQQGKAPLIILLDDDAVLGNKDCLVRLLEEFEADKAERPKAIVSFKVIYYDTGKMQENALPHKQFNRYKDLSFFETYYYAGGAHAIRRDVLEKVGAYPEDFFYGMEEYDLSYRILDAGYSIVYTDKIIMRHKESPLGRKPAAQKLRMMWVNKSKVAYRYLPPIYFYTTALLWSFQYLRITGFKMGDYIKGWKEISRILRSEKRTPVSRDTLVYLKRLKARLWY